MNKDAQPDVTVLRVDERSRSTGHSLSGSRASSAEVSGVLKQRFILEDKLGSGGMGTVFRAKDLRKVEAQDRHPYLAIKVLNNEFRDHPDAFIALQREASKSQSLSHPNLVSIYDFDKDGDVPFMTMELLTGHELSSLLRSYPNGLPKELAWPVIEGLCAGLQHAHDAGIVHADFKPGNVFIEEGAHAKIFDFGIARAMHVNRLHGEETAFDVRGLGALTPAYASTETLNGETPEPRDDIFALAIVVYLILTGRHPYGRTPADEAERAGLTPEKPNNITHRQWQALKSGLAFRRQHRPVNVAWLADRLLNPSFWKTRAGFGLAAIVLVAVGFGYSLDTTEIEQVKEAAVEDVRIERINTLISSPRFDESWQQQLWQETESLKTSSATLDTKPAIIADIIALYATQVAATKNFEKAHALLLMGNRYRELGEVREALVARLVQNIQTLLAAPVASDVWVSDLEKELARFARFFPDHPERGIQMAEITAELTARTELSLQRGEIVLARDMFQLTQGDEFEYESVEKIEKQLDVAEENTRMAAEQSQFSVEVDQLLDTSCLRIDMAKLQTNYRRLVAQYPDLRSQAHKRVISKLVGCVQTLATSDRDRALNIQQQGLERFAPADRLSAVQFDPCSLEYLSVRGVALGQSGHCVDRLGETGKGPKLVVVANPEDATGEERFAITKDEVTWSEFSQFCADTTGCERLGENSRPVTHIDFKLALAFANWLSERTGYLYRLPTRQEWLTAAQGDPDPNRNCRVSLAGVERGINLLAANSGAMNGFGLRNTLGNAREWVYDGEVLQAVGGGFSDPIDECQLKTVANHDGQADETTGFRLVREIS